MRNKWFVITNEYLLAHTVGGSKLNLDTPPAPIEESRKLGLCNGFRIWLEPTKEKIDRCAKDNGFVMVDFWPGALRLKEWAARQNMSLEEYLNSTVRLMLESMERYGKRFWWTVTAEVDSVCPWPKERFSSKNEAYEWFRNWLLSHVPNHDNTQGIAWSKFLAQYGIDYDKHNIAIQCGFPFDVHLAYEVGARLVWLEENCHILPNVQIGIAFLRGAANQYRHRDVAWGVDFSTWSSPSGLCTCYDQEGRRLGGCTENLLLREWLVAAMSGTNMLHQETSDNSHWITRSDGTKTLSLLGKIAKRFGEFFFKKIKDRGKPYIPVAVMLEKSHGWLPTYDEGGANKIWVGTIPYRKADITIDAFFSEAFPGYDAIYHGLGDQYCKTPWSTSKEYGEKVVRNENVDERLLEKGRLVPSRWGDIIDIVLEDCPEDVLGDYKVLFLLGELKITPDLLTKLTNYVTAGGTVVTNVTNLIEVDEESLESRIGLGGFKDGMRYHNPSKHGGKVLPGAEEFTGVRLTGIKQTSGVSHCITCGKIFNEKGMIYELVEPVTAKVIADTQPMWSATGERFPIITENRIGKGKVILTLPYFLLHPTRHNLLQIGRDIYSHIIKPLLPIQIEGAPIQYLVNKIEDGFIVTLVNNDAYQWEGEIVFDGKSFNSCGELWEGRNLPVSKNDGQGKVSLHIAPFEFAVCRLSRKKGKIAYNGQSASAQKIF